MTDTELPPAKTPSRGWQGAVLKLMNADDYEFTVTSTERLTEHYLRLGFTGGGLLKDRPLHPTMWVRIWFQTKAGKLHQRGYTIIDADPTADSFFIEFAVHEGAAARWAQNAKPGDTIGVTFMGSKDALPEQPPAGWLMVGDTASLPAINSLLDAIGDVPATIWFEYQHETDRELPIRLRQQDTIHWVKRGEGLLDMLRDKAFDATGHQGWVAADTKLTRGAVSILRSDFKIDRKAVKSQAYWMVTNKQS